MDDVTPDHWPATPFCATHGSNGEIWLSRRPLELQLAAALCVGCPVTQECFAYAETLRNLTVRHHEPNPRPWGVWAGVMYDGTGKPPVKLPWPTTPDRSIRERERRNRVRTEQARQRREAS